MKQSEKRLIQILKSSAGMTLIEIMMVVGLTGIVMTSIIQMLQVSAKQQLQATLTFQAQQIEKNLNKVINDPVAWRTMVANNASLACIKNGTPCTKTNQDLAAGGQPITSQPIYSIYDQKGDPLYNFTSPNSGFMPSGKTCTTYIPKPGVPANNLCPLRFEIVWDAICSTANGTCVNPTVKIYINAFYNPDPKLAVILNTINYSTWFYQGGDGTQACDWGWSITSNQLTEVCAPFVGIGVDAVTHLATRMEVFGVQKIYGQGPPNVDENGNNAVYINGHGIDGGRSGVAFGFGNALNGSSMANTAYISAESQGVQYRNLVLNPLATGSGNGYVGINTVSPYAPLDVQVDGSHKLVFRTAVVPGANSAAIGAMNNNTTGWVPLELVGGPVILQSGGGANQSKGDMVIYGNHSVSGNEQISGSGTVTNNWTIGGNEQVNGSTQVNGNIATSNNVYIGALRNWITEYINQPVRTIDAPTFSGLTVNGGATTLNSGALNMNNGPLNVNNGDTTLTNGSLYVNSGGNNRFTVKSSGNIGIGTSNPQYMVEVRQNGASGGQSMVALTDANVVVGYNISAGNGSAVGQIGTISRHPFQLYAGNFAFTTLYATGKLEHNGLFVVNGNARADAFVNNSDRRLKTDIRPIDQPLETLLKLEGVQFKWKKTNKEDIGFIAQEVEKVYPQLVAKTDGKIEGEETKILGVEYGNIVAVVVEAIKTLSGKIDDLIAKVDTLISQQATLASENAQLKSDNAAMKARLDAIEAALTKK